MYVLDFLLRVRPPYVLGEIFIGGLGVAKEYFKDPERTSSAFILHEKFGRLYRTGDEGRYLPSGEIQIIGRMDQQVKVNGYRVELEEIEKTASQVLSGGRAVVVAKRDAEGVTHLRGFLCLEPDAKRDEKEVSSAVRTHLQAVLPSYMWPESWTHLREVPHSLNGKVDKNKLWDLGAEPTSNATSKQPPGASRVHYREALLQHARGLLQKPALDKDENLVSAGMTSIRMREFNVRICKELGIRVPTHAVMDHPTVAKFAEHLLDLGRPPAEPEDRLSPPIERPLESSRMFISSFAQRFPGSFSGFYRGTDCQTTVPLSRFDIEEYFSPDEAGKAYTRHGAFLPSVEAFDPGSFNLGDAEAAGMDPQQRLGLTVARAALPSMHDLKDLAVFVGQMNYDWMVASRAPAPYGSTGIAPSILANRISYCFDLRGPSMSVDTACSSSLVAVYLAARHLGSSLVLGSTVLLAPDMYLTACKAGMLSPRGRCATLDQSANGFARGEGVAAVLLAPDFGQAIEEKSQLLGAAVNQSGKIGAITHPNSHAQEAVIRRALGTTQASEILAHELHGTGTPLGDPLESEALGRVMGKSEVVLQALKTHWGHLEGSAGLAGFLKQVLLAHRRVAAPNLHLRQLNRDVELPGLRSQVCV